jgi:Fur family zinc uptake transcriptional regulator
MRDIPSPPDRAQRLAALGRVPREVYELLSRSPTPLKAYDMLWRLQAERGRSAPPSTVYRAVAILIEAGLVHRIDALSAYVVCALPDFAHEPAFLVCDKCGAAAEIDATATHARLAQALAKSGSDAHTIRFTLRGVCAACGA